MSVDTKRSQVAAEAVAAGATIVNDVSGGLADPAILDVVAETGTTYVCMHWRAHSDHMQDFASYDGPGGVLAAVRDELCERVDAARAAGIVDENIVLDPGLGFAKNARHSFELLARLAELTHEGVPVVVGASRKSFLASLDGAPPAERLGGSIAAGLIAVERGAAVLRVHDVLPARQALAVTRRAQSLELTPEASHA